MVLVLALGLAACSSGGLGETAVTTTAPPEDTSRQASDNEESCEHLREVNGINARTAALSREVVDLVLSEADDAAVLGATEALAAHLESTAPEVAAAYAAATESAPASAAEAIEALAASAEVSVPRLVELLRSARSGQEVAALYAAVGGAAVPEQPEGDDELRRTLSRYTDVICGFSMTG